jgi:hypothetical protein
MADIDITKIIVLNGPASALPVALDSGEFGFAKDQGRLFLGSNPVVGQPQYQRTAFPYQNIEVLTENATDLFAKMHGDRMREGGGSDYYATYCYTGDDWQNVTVTRDGVLAPYRIRNLTALSAFIDYTLIGSSDRPARAGQMVLQYAHADNQDAVLHDNGSSARDLTQSAPQNYDPSIVFGQVMFRFVVAGSVTSPYLQMQYRNYSTEVFDFRFRVSRPDYLPGFDITPETFYFDLGTGEFLDLGTGDIFNWDELHETV